MVGQTLSHYKILQRIGAGGMGEVYLAEDKTLNRRVALKVLPPELAESDDRRDRFTREAKALAALNHPNIVTVHSVENKNGVHFITMELVKGKTLAELLPRQGFSLDRFFDIAVPLADAVAAAHEHGIVHRDLKPGNVMVGDDGRVKVLDFGLATPTAGVAGTGVPADLPTAVKTAEGVIVGTWSYMSPEQARGQAVDARSDIFSLGIIFYEMLTGSRPFAGNTPTEALSSIIKDIPPAVTEIRSGIPRELSRLVRRCLAKDPSRRMQSALDVRNELEELRREIESGDVSVQIPSGDTKMWRSRPVVLSVALVAGGLIAGLVAWLSTRPAPLVVLPLQNAVQVTSAAGVETQVTWSPDGGRLAYMSEQSGNQDIWISQAGGGPASNLTGDYIGSDSDPAWSPDGTQIAFRSAREGNGIFVMPSIGGTPLRIASRGSSETIGSPRWSADGQRLAFLRRENEGGVIEIVSMRTRESHRISIPGDRGNRFDLSWSPDDRFFAFVRAPQRTEGASTVWVLRAADGKAFAVTNGMSADWSPIWSKDPLTLFYVSNRSGSMDLWRQQLSADGTPTGQPVAVTVGVGLQQAAFSRDGRKLAYSKGQPVTNVWRVPLSNGREATWQDAEQLTFDEAYIGAFDLFPDGERLVVSSDRGGNLDLWTVALHRNQLTQLTSDPGPDWQPSVSPDGQRIAFYSYRAGNRDIWVMPSEGGPATQLTGEEGHELGPSWSPDGRELAFHSDRGDITNVFVVPAAGGIARQVTNSREAVYSARWSPDGAWIAYVSRQRLWRIPASGGMPERLSETLGPAGTYTWSRNGLVYCVAAPTDEALQVWVVIPASGVERPVTRLSGRAGNFGPGLAVGRTHLYFTWSSDLGDIWVADVVTDQGDD